MSAHRAARACAAAALGSLLLLLAGCSAEDRLCRRMGELCGTQSAECRSSVEGLRGALGSEAVTELERCYADADSCAEAKGCEAALALKGAAGAASDFLESFGESLKDEKRDD